MDKVSLIVPILNEERYIISFLQSVINQDFSHKDLELLMVDGQSEDKTRKLIVEFMENKDIKYKILDNPKRFTPIAMNIGIKACKHEFIIRLDAHSEYPTDYVSKCIHYLKDTDAWNVGCVLKASYNNDNEKTIAKLLSSKFGVGNSGFRTNAKSGYVDTVPFGAFRKDLFRKIGLFDERLHRNQDSELNARILKNGGKIYLFNDISIDYYPRNTIKKLLKMGFQNGKWNIYTTMLCPGSMKIRHFIPFLFVISLIIGTLVVLIQWRFLSILFLFELIMYSLLDIYFSIRLSETISELLKLFLLFPAFHAVYGFGSIVGLGKCLCNWKKKYKIEFIS